MDGTSVGGLYYDLDINDGNLEGQLDSADKKVSGFADKLHDGLKKAAVGFAVVGVGLTAISKQATDFAVDAVKSAKNLGVQIGTTTEEASRLVAAFGRMGVSAQDASSMFGIFSKNITQATKDIKDQADSAQTNQIAIEKTQRAIADTTLAIKTNGDKTGDLAFRLKDLNNQLATQQAALKSSQNAFQQLGVSTVDASGNQKDFESILFEVADKFKTLPDGVDKTTLSMDLFGRSGKDMIKVLNLGSQGIKDLESQADKLGITLTSQNISAVNDYVQSQKELKASSDSLKLAIGTTTAPVLADFNKALNSVITSLIGTDGPLRTITVDIIAFGGPVASAGAAFANFGSNMVTIIEAMGAATAALAAALAVVAIAVVAADLWALQHTQELGAAFVTVTDTIQMKLTALWNWVMQYWPVLAGALVGPFGIAAAAIVTNLGGMRDNIVNWASGAVSWLYNAGESIVQGLINGIKDRIGDAVNAVKNAGNSIINSARSVLGWHSPSTVFMEAGKSIADGLAIGINRNANTAQMALNNLAGSVIAPAINVASNHTQAQGGGSATTYGDTIVSIGQVNSQSDADYILNRMDRDQSLELNGISPQRSS